MDWITYTNAGLSFVKKYRYAFLAVVIGLLLLLLPVQDSPEPETAPETTHVTENQNTLEDSLAEILSLIDGVGKTKVLLTLSRGEDILYQTDSDTTSGGNSADTHIDTVLVTGSDRTETGLIKQVNPPLYRGAVVVCQGAGNPEVRLSVVEAVMRATGLTSDKITVLKMK